MRAQDFCTAPYSLIWHLMQLYIHNHQKYSNHECPVWLCVCACARDFWLNKVRNTNLIQSPPIHILTAQDCFHHTFNKSIVHVEKSKNLISASHIDSYILLPEGICQSIHTLSWHERKLFCCCGTMMVCKSTTWNPPLFSRMLSPSHIAQTLDHRPKKHVTINYFMYSSTKMVFSFFL